MVKLDDKRQDEIFWYITLFSDPAHPDATSEKTFRHQEQVSWKHRF